MTWRGGANYGWPTASDDGDERGSLGNGRSHGRSRRATGEPHPRHRDCRKVEVVSTAVASAAAVPKACDVETTAAKVVDVTAKVQQQKSRPAASKFAAAWSLRRDGRQWVTPGRVVTGLTAM